MPLSPLSFRAVRSRASAARTREESAVRALVDLLRNHPNLGRAGVEPGIRELIIAGPPYIVLYRVQGGQVTINTIWHAAQGREI